MRLRLMPLAWVFWSLATLLVTGAGQEAAERAVATSHDGRIRLELSLAEGDRAGMIPVHAILFRGRPVVLPSRLGGDLAGRALASTR